MCIALDEDALRRAHRILGRQHCALGATGISRVLSEAIMMQASAAVAGARAQIIEPHAAAHEYMHSWGA